jgi:hypothetical protein
MDASVRLYIVFCLWVGSPERERRPDWTKRASLFARILDAIPS